MIEDVCITNRIGSANLMRSNLNSFPYVHPGLANIMQEEVKDQSIKLINKYNLLKVESL